MTKTTSSPKAPMILGGCGCVSLLAGALMLASTFFLGGASLPGEPAIEMATYTNTREGRTGNLEQSYVDFSFQHPADWDVRTVDPDNINFVTVERKSDGRTWENLNVGYFTPSPIPGQNEALYAQTLGQIEGQFAQQFQDFRKISEGPAKVAEYDAYEALYAGYLETNGQRVDVFTRAMFVPSPDGTRGVSMMMMGTSLCPDLKEPQDLATKGQLPAVLSSFRFGG